MIEYILFSLIQTKNVFVHHLFHPSVAQTHASIFSLYLINTRESYTEIPGTFGDLDEDTLRYLMTKFPIELLQTFAEVSPVFPKMVKEEVIDCLRDVGLAPVEMTGYGYGESLSFLSRQDNHDKRS